MEVVLAPLAGYLIEIILAVLAVIAAWVGSKVRDKFGVETDSKLNAVINEALQAGLAYAQVKLEEGGNKLTYETKNEFVATAVEYIVKGVPNALNHFAITPERLAEMVEARLSGRIAKE